MSLSFFEALKQESKQGSRLRPLRSALVFGFLGMIPLLVGLGFLSMSLAFSERASAKAEGVVVAVAESGYFRNKSTVEMSETGPQLRPNYTWSYVPVVSFVAADGKQYQVVSQLALYQPGLRSRTPQFDPVGRKVNVAYDPHDPSYAGAVEFNPSVIAPFFVSFVAFFIASLFFVFRKCIYDFENRNFEK